MKKNIWKHLLLELGQFLSKPRSESAIKKFLYILFGVTFLIMTYLLSFPFLGVDLNYQVGDRPEEEIRVPHDIRYELKEKTKQLQDDAYRRRRYVFDRDFVKFNKVINKYEDEFERIFLTSVSYGGATEKSYEKIVDNFRWLRKYKSSQVKECLRASNRNKAIAWGRAYAREIFDRFGVLTHTLPRLRSFYSVGAVIRSINTPDNIEEKFFDSDQIIGRKSLFGRSYIRLKTLGDESFRQKLSSGCTQIIIHRLIQLFYRYPFLAFNEVETKHRKDEARQMVKPATDVLEKGMVIVRAGEVITKESLRKIQILNENKKDASVKYILGMFLIQLLLSFSVTIFIYRFSEMKLVDLSSHVILHSLLILTILIALPISNITNVENGNIFFALCVPFGFISVMLTILFGPRLTVIVGVYLSIFLYMFSNYEESTLLFCFISLIGGIYAADRMERRTHFLKGALVLSLSLAGMSIGIDLIKNQLWQNTTFKIAIAFLNGFGSLILAAGVLPIYELVFNLATKFRLMELADYNNELLKKVSNEAPSTYTHSLMVASLSEKAVSAIGGDSLLTRVGCLYHDIGKTLNPSFYTENRHLFPNQKSLKELGAEKSAQIIIEHVTGGITMAREHRLPEKIIDFIPEHHGTTIMQFFYHEALKENSKKKRKREIDAELFRYPGPMPKSKETGIVMIADSVEAASRSIKVASRENLGELVEKIIENKMHENQFDECPLTIRDLKLIKNAFVDVLESAFHGRPIYPDMKATNKLAAANQNKKVKKTVKQI